MPWLFCDMVVVYHGYFSDGVCVFFYYMLELCCERMKEVCYMCKLCRVLFMRCTNYAVYLLCSVFVMTGTFLCIVLGMTCTNYAVRLLCRVLVIPRT